MEAWRAELYHHGIKGMKWGVRRFQNKDGTLTALGRKIAERQERARENETAYRKKMSKIADRAYTNVNDAGFAKYRSQTLPKRVAASATTAVIQTLMRDMATGAFDDYASMSKADMTKKLMKIGVAAVANTAVSDALAKSVSKRYDESGKKVKKDDKGSLSMTKEAWINTGITNAVSAAVIFGPQLYATLAMKAYKLNQQRAQYQADFERWGGNILEAKLEDVIDVTDFKVIK